jgi:hypothetical protein
MRSLGLAEGNRAENISPQSVLALHAVHESAPGTLSPLRSWAERGQLCPVTSDVDFLRTLKGVIDLNAQVSNCALDLRVAEEQLNGP